MKPVLVRGLLQAASVLLATHIADLRVNDGEIVAPDGQRTTYWDLTSPALLDHDASGQAPPKPPGSRRVIGKNVPRLDLPDKIDGRPPFIQDLALPGQLYGRVVRPPSPAATLTDVDVRPAVSQLGIVAVVHDGSFLGVVAENEDVAARAAQTLRSKTDWTERPSLPDEEALEAYLRSEPTETFVAHEHRNATDDRVAVRTASATFTRPFLAHASIAPSCGVARWDGEQVSIWTHSQGIFGLRAAVADALGVDTSLITAHHVQSAGCYGHNGADDAAFDAVLLARHVPGRPLHVLWSREDELSWSPFGSAMAVDLRLASTLLGRSCRGGMRSGATATRPVPATPERQACFQRHM